MASPAPELEVPWGQTIQKAELDYAFWMQSKQLALAAETRAITLMQGKSSVACSSSSSDASNPLLHTQHTMASNRVYEDGMNIEEGHFSEDPSTSTAEARAVASAEGEWLRSRYTVQSCYMAETNVMLVKSSTPVVPESAGEHTCSVDEYSSTQTIGTSSRSQVDVEDSRQQQQQCVSDAELDRQCRSTPHDVDTATAVVSDTVPVNTELEVSEDPISDVTDNAGTTMSSVECHADAGSDVGVDIATAEVLKQRVASAENAWIQQSVARVKADQTCADMMASHAAVSTTAASATVITCGASASVVATGDDEGVAETSTASTEPDAVHTVHHSVHADDSEDGAAADGAAAHGAAADGAAADGAAADGAAADGAAADGAAADGAAADGAAADGAAAADVGVAADGAAADGAAAADVGGGAAAADVGGGTGGGAAADDVLLCPMPDDDGAAGRLQQVACGENAWLQQSMAHTCADQAETRILSAAPTSTTERAGSDECDAIAATDELAGELSALDTSPVVQASAVDTLTASSLSCDTPTNMSPEPATLVLGEETPPAAAATDIRNTTPTTRGNPDDCDPAVPATAHGVDKTLLSSSDNSSSHGDQLMGKDAEPAGSTSGTPALATVLATSSTDATDGAADAAHSTACDVAVPIVAIEDAVTTNMTADTSSEAVLSSQLESAVSTSLATSNTDCSEPFPSRVEDGRRQPQQQHLQEHAVNPLPSEDTHKQPKSSLTGRADDLESKPAADKTSPVRRKKKVVKKKLKTKTSTPVSESPATVCNTGTVAASDIDIFADGAATAAIADSAPVPADGAVRKVKKKTTKTKTDGEVKKKKKKVVKKTVDAAAVGESSTPTNSTVQSSPKLSDDVMLAKDDIIGMETATEAPLDSSARPLAMASPMPVDSAALEPIAVASSSDVIPTRDDITALESNAEPSLPSTASAVEPAADVGNSTAVDEPDLGMHDDPLTTYKLLASTDDAADRQDGDDYARPVSPTAAATGHNGRLLTQDVLVSVSLPSEQIAPSAHTTNLQQDSDEQHTQHTLDDGDEQRTLDELAGESMPHRDDNNELADGTAPVLDSDPAHSGHTDDDVENSDHHDIAGVVGDTTPLSTQAYQDDSDAVVDYAVAERTDSAAAAPTVLDESPVHDHQVRDADHGLGDVTRTTDDDVPDIGRPAATVEPAHLQNPTASTVTLDTTNAAVSSATATGTAAVASAVEQQPILTKATPGPGLVPFHQQQDVVASAAHSVGVDLMALKQQQQHLSALYPTDIRECQNLLREERTRRIVAEKLVDIVQEESSTAMRQLSSETTVRLKVESDLSDVKAELRKEKETSQNLTQRVKELEQSLEGTSHMVRKLEHQLTNSMALRGGMDYMLDAKISRSRASEAEAKLEVTQSELVQAQSEVQHLLERLQDLTSSRKEMVSSDVHSRLLSISDERAVRAEEEVRRLQDEMSHIRVAQGLPPGHHSGLAGSSGMGAYSHGSMFNTAGAASTAHYPGSTSSSASLYGSSSSAYMSSMSSMYGAPPPSSTTGAAEPLGSYASFLQQTAHRAAGIASSPYSAWGQMPPSTSSTAHMSPYGTSQQQPSWASTASSSSSSAYQSTLAGHPDHTYPTSSAARTPQRQFADILESSKAGSTKPSVIADAVKKQPKDASTIESEVAGSPASSPRRRLVQLTPKKSETRQGVGNSDDDDEDISDWSSDGEDDDAKPRTAASLKARFEKMSSPGGVKLPAGVPKNAVSVMSQAALAASVTTNTNSSSSTLTAAAPSDTTSGSAEGGSKKPRPAVKPKPVVAGSRPAHLRQQISKLEEEVVEPPSSFEKDPIPGSMVRTLLRRAPGPTGRRLPTRRGTAAKSDSLFVM